ELVRGHRTKKISLEFRQPCQHLAEFVGGEVAPQRLWRRDVAEICRRSPLKPPGGGQAGRACAAIDGSTGRRDVARRQRLDTSLIQEQVVRAELARGEGEHPNLVNGDWEEGTGPFRAAGNRKTARGRVGLCGGVRP